MSNSDQDEKWALRNRIEEMHAATPGGAALNRLRHALGLVRDKNSVLQIASEVLNSPPVEDGNVFRFGKIELTFDDDSNLSSLSTGSIMIKEERSKR